MAERRISVGELLRREGHQSEAHDSQARRALGGVAVGAVLAFGAVVGGLVLHNAGATPSDMPAAGGGTAGGAGFNGSVPVASTGTIGSNSPKVQPAANTTTVNPGITKSGTTAKKSGNALGGGAAAPIAPTTDSSSVPSSTGSQPTSTGSTSTGTSTGSSSTGGGTSTSTGSSSSNSGTSASQPATGTNSGGGTTSGNGGGLLGAVGSTLGSVTQPVFSWFGGN